MYQSNSLCFFVSFFSFFNLAFLACFQVHLLKGLNRARGVEILKCEFILENESHALTRAKYAMILAKANKWKSNAIGKEEKVSKAIIELNDNPRCFVELEKA